MFLFICVKKPDFRSTLVNTFMRHRIILTGMEPVSNRRAMFTCTPVLKNTPFYHSTSISPNFVRLFNTSMVNRQEEKAHDHARLWVIEKGTSALLVALIPIALLIPNKLFDSILAVLITAHTYWGMEAVMVEYIRVLLFGPLIPRIAIGFVYVMTVLMLGGLFYLIFNDIGLCRAFWRIWRNMRKPKDTFKRR